MDKWHGLISNLRKMLKGWGNNLRGDFRRKKEELLARIKSLDDLLTSDEATGNEGEERSRLESELEALFEEEEIYWQQRGVEKQILEGDANTAFFHLSTNGRRRKKNNSIFGTGWGEYQRPKTHKGDYL